MGNLIGLLVGKRILGRTITEGPARIIVMAALFLAALAVIGMAKCSYDRAVISRHVAQQEAKQTKRERRADNNLNEQKQKDDQAAAERKKEIDNATRNIPDQMPSARQRARACVELRRQARAQGRTEPAC